MFYVVIGLSVLALIGVYIWLEKSLHNSPLHERKAIVEQNAPLLYSCKLHTSTQMLLVYTDLALHYGWDDVAEIYFEQYIHNKAEQVISEELDFKRKVREIIKDEKNNG